MGNAKHTDDVFLHEFLCVRFDYFGQWLSFDPFSKVVNCNISKTRAAPSLGHRSNEIDSSLGEWPRARNTQLLGRLSLNCGKMLALVTFFGELLDILFQSQLVVSLP